MVAFSRLPDACLQALFKQLPPEDQLRARSVCRKWDALVPVAAGTRRSLIIILGNLPRDFDKFHLDESIDHPVMHRVTNEDGSPMFPRKPATIWNSLHFPHLLKEDNWRLIPTTFTGVEHLKGIFTSQEAKQMLHLTLFAILLELWHNQLTSVHLLQFSSQPDILQATSDRLYATINSLPHLKRLVLNLYKIPLQDLPVIAHLEELVISAAIPIDTPNRDPTRYNRQLVEMLQKYGRLDQGLPRVSYTNGVRGPYEPLLKSLTSLGANMCQAFTRLGFFALSLRELSIVCNHFHGLTRITLMHSFIDVNDFVPLFQELSKLKQLVYLWLPISIRELPLPNGHRALPQLPSVKALILYLQLPTPQHMNALNIGWLFPNLQVIEFVFHRGVNFLGCGFNNLVHFPNGNLMLAKECLRQVFRPLKRRFGNKLIILHNLDNILDGICSAEELLASM